MRFRVAGASRARTFVSEDKARAWQGVLDGAGPDVACKLLDDTAAGTAVQQDLTLTAWMTRHVDALSGVTPGTQKTYRACVRDDIAPTIGHLPLPVITREVVGAWVNALAARGLSGKSIRNRHSLLSSALTAAVRAGHIPTNHAKGVRLPRTSHTTAEMVVLDPAERNRLLAALPAHYRPLVATLLLTGLRWGEATALTVAHVDLGAAALRVRQAWKFTGNGTLVLGPPKSAKGVRSISLSSTAADVIALATAGKAPGDYVFTTPRGYPLRQGTFYGRVWQPAVAAFAGDSVDPTTRALVRGTGKRPRIHDLRHTHASALIASGVPLDYVKRQLGHDSIATTSDVYGHLLPGAHEQMTAATEIAFSGLNLGTIEALGAAPAGAAPVLSLPSGG